MKQIKEFRQQKVKWDDGSSKSWTVILLDGTQRDLDEAHAGLVRVLVCHNPDFPSSSDRDDDAPGGAVVTTQCWRRAVADNQAGSPDS